MQVQQHILKNKLKTLFINAQGATSCTVQIWFRAGSSLEKKEDLGIAHFLEHMFFKGTPKRPGAKIAKEVESFGGEINAFTSFDYTCYYINSPVTHLNDTVDILLDMVANPLFTKEDLIPEREVVFEEYRRSLDNPSQFAFKELQQSCFSGGYHHQILGTEKTIKNFSRTQLVNFRKKHYNLANAMLVVAGDLKNQKAINKIIEKYKIPNGIETDFSSFKLNSKSTINIHLKEVRQAVLTLCLQAPAYNHESTAAEDLAINAFAHGESSRLYTKLVYDSSLCSTVSGSTMYMADGGSHFIRFVCPEKNLKEVLEKFAELLKETYVEGFEGSEVLKIKNQYIASKIYEKESLEAYSFSKGYGFAQTGDIHCEEGFIERIKETKTQSVNASIRHIFSRPLHISLQLPKSEKKDDYKPMLEKLTADLKKIISAKKNQINFPTKTSKFDPMVKTLLIKEGVHLIYRHNPMTPTFVFHTYTKGGIAYETQANNGYFHLLTQLMTMGYDGVDYDDIKLDLENKSASISGFAGKNAYGITSHGQTEHFEEIMNVFFGSLLRPDLPDKYLNHEKEIIYRIFENQKEDPVKQCFKIFNKLIFGEHPYSLDHIGTKEIIEKLNRHDLEKLHQAFLQKEEMVMTYCGDLDLETLLELLTPYLEKIEARKHTVSPRRPVDEVIGTTKHLNFDREQTQVLIARSGYKLGDKEDLMVKMLTTHLSGQGSDLFVEVRDRQGLCYSVQPLHMSALEGGYWGIFMACGFDKTKRAIAAIHKILDQLKTKGLSKNEFETIKKVIEGQSLLNIQTNEDYANIYSVPTLHNLGIDYSKLNQLKAKKITLTEFNNFLKKFLTVEFNQITVGREWN